MPTPSTRAQLAPLLAGALLLGVGQQLFVALRNPYLADLGVAVHVVPYVQGTGATAGVLGAWLATRAGGRSVRSTFVACALVQAIGFALQLVGGGLLPVFLGAALAGVAIQMHTALAPPLLRAVEPAARMRAFALWSMALTPGAGIVAALAVQPATRAFGRTVATERLVLAGGAVISALTVLAFARLGAGPAYAEASSRAREAPRRVAALVAFQALTGFAGGIAVPLLHLHFRLAFGVPLDCLALLHGGTMLVGLVAAACTPWLVRRLGHVRTLVILYALAAPLFLELAATTDLRVAIALFVLRHALVNLTTPVAQALFQELVSPDDASAVAGYGVMASAAAWSIGAFLAGPLVARHGESLTAPMIASAAGFAFSAIGAAVLFPAMWRSRSRA